MDPPLRTCLGLTGLGQVLFLCHEPIHSPIRSKRIRTHNNARIAAMQRIAGSQIIMQNTKYKMQNEGRITRPKILLFAFCIFHFPLLPLCQAAPALTAQQDSAASSAQAALANAFAGLVERAIPRHYEKRRDWGKTKNITVGIRRDGIKLHRRKKPVNHGVWKHYKINLIEPDKTLAVQIENLRASDNGRVAFTLALQIKFDLWARTKIYKYGVHLIALETVGDAAIDLEIDCEIGMKFQTQQGSAGIAIDPQVTDARLDITDFHLRRISNAKGPVIRELGEELPRIIERELQGPKLVAKINKAINKKRDRLELNFWNGEPRSGEPN